MNRKKDYPLYETTAFTDFRQMIEQSAEKFGDKTAYSYKCEPNDVDVQKITYRASRDAIRSYGTEEIALGLCDKKCAIIGATSLGWVHTYYSLMAIGAVTVPLDKDMPAAELAATAKRAGVVAIFYGSEIEGKLDYIRENSGAEIYVCMNGERSAENKARGDLDMREMIEAGTKRFADGDDSYYRREIDPDRLASIVFTSGTTGKGKGVMLSQTNIAADMTQGMYNFTITPKTICLLPPHHTFGSSINLTGHYAQGVEVYLTSGVKYLLRELKEQKPQHLILVPLFVETLYRKIWSTAEKNGSDKKLKKAIKISAALRRVGIDLRKKLFASVNATFGGELELVICGGAALNQDIIDFFDAIGITLLNGYGITECAPLISANRNEWQKNGSVGTPIIGELVKIDEPDANGEGEICVKGPNVMLGYYDDPEATAAAFDSEGYFRTGDYGKLDEDGWIYITGRKKNLIIFSNGKNVYPEEIETEITRIRGVREVVVYAGESRKNRDREIIVAEIFPDREQLEADGVSDVERYFNDNVRAVNARMAPYKKVGLVKIRSEEFVKNTSRKITRFDIDKSVD